MPDGKRSRFSESLDPGHLSRQSISGETLECFTSCITCITCLAGCYVEATRELHSDSWLILAETRDDKRFP